MDEDKTIRRRFRRVLLEMPVVDWITSAKYSRALPGGGLYIPTQLTQEWPCNLLWLIECGLRWKLLGRSFKSQHMDCADLSFPLM